jgi:ribosome maturation factor RimP
MESSLAQKIHAVAERVGASEGLEVVEDVVPGGRYNLEVSSPGVERKLFRQKDFDRFSGQKIKVVLKEPRDGRKTFEGVFRAGEPGEITLEVSPKLTIPLRLDEIARANLKFDWH